MEVLRAHTRIGAAIEVQASAFMRLGAPGARAGALYFSYVEVGSDGRARTGRVVAHTEDGGRRLVTLHRWYDASPSPPGRDLNVCCGARAEPVPSREIRADGRPPDRGAPAAPAPS